MEFKKKHCEYHNDLCFIFKNYEGKRYCKIGWAAINPKGKKTIAPRSKKRAAEEKEYSKVRIEYLVANPVCEAKLYGCTKEATDIHHTKGRIGKLLVDKRWFKSVCRNCHSWIEEHPEEAKKLNLSKSRLSNE